MYWKVGLSHIAKMEFSDSHCSVQSRLTLPVVAWSSTRDGHLRRKCRVVRHRYPRRTVVLFVDFSSFLSAYFRKINILIEFITPKLLIRPKKDARDVTLCFESQKHGERRFRLGVQYLTAIKRHGAKDQTTKNVTQLYGYALNK